jgi:hypothetical protein
MNMLRKLAFLTILLTFFILLALPGPAKASSSAASSNLSQNHRDLNDQVVFGDTYTLHNGDTLVGDLFILGGTVTLEDGSTVDGSVALVGGTLTIRGTVNKDLVALGGTAKLENSGYIKGNAVTLGGQLSGTSGRVNGKVITDIGSVFQIRLFDQRYPTVGVARIPYVWGVLSLFFSAFFMTSLAIGTVLFLPKQTERTAKMLIQQPVASGGMGCLTILVVPIVLVALAVTIILSPVSLIGAILLVALIMFGWIALGLELGNRLAKALHHEWHPAVSAGIGTFGLTLVSLGLSRIIICVGWMIPFLVSMVALGAVVLVFFGGRTPSVPATLVVQPTWSAPVVESTSGVSAPPEEIQPDSSADDEIPPAS